MLRTDLRDVPLPYADEIAEAITEWPHWLDELLENDIATWAKQKP
jgi:hypothetical protein